MLATLERPIVAPIMPLIDRPDTSLTPAPTAPPRLTLVPVPIRSVKQLPALAPVRPEISVQQAVPAPPLRLTMRARRLLAGLGLLCCAALGVVAVDVLAALVPSASATSYVAQRAPYVAEGSVDAGGLVPSSGSSVTVSAGDTLWSLAQRVDPDADPRDVIAAIMALNDLDSPSLQAGQVLRLP